MRARTPATRAAGAWRRRGLSRSALTSALSSWQCGPSQCLSRPRAPECMHGCHLARLSTTTHAHPPPCLSRALGALSCHSRRESACLTPRNAAARRPPAPRLRPRAAPRALRTHAPTRWRACACRLAGADEPTCWPLWSPGSARVRPHPRSSSTATFLVAIPRSPKRSAPSDAVVSQGDSLSPASCPFASAPVTSLAPTDPILASALGQARCGPAARQLQAPSPTSSHTPATAHDSCCLTSHPCLLLQERECVCVCISGRSSVRGLAAPPGRQQGCRASEGSWRLQQTRQSGGGGK
eukprot:360252-Chlamydomonas_euryale.AAC.8